MKKTLAALLSVAVLSGCSSIISKSDYAVAINSSPDQANFVVTNRAGKTVHSGITPGTVTLKSSAGYYKGETYTIRFTKDGFPNKEFTLKSTVDGWFFGNILFGGLIGMLIVDPLTGAMYNLPTDVDVTLGPEHSANEAATGLTVATLDSLSPEQVAQLQEIR